VSDLPGTAGSLPGTTSPHKRLRDEGGPSDPGLPYQDTPPSKRPVPGAGLSRAGTPSGRSGQGTMAEFLSAEPRARQAMRQDATGFGRGQGPDSGWGPGRPAPDTAAGLQAARDRAELAERRLREAEQSITLWKGEADQTMASLAASQAEIAELRAQAEAGQDRRRRGLHSIARSMMELEDAAERRRIAEDEVSLGRLVARRPASLVPGTAANAGLPGVAGVAIGADGRAGGGDMTGWTKTPAAADKPVASLEEPWDDGIDVVECKRRLAEVQERRRVLEERKRALAKRWRLLKRELGDDASEEGASPSASSAVTDPGSRGAQLLPEELTRAHLVRLDHVEAEEAVKTRLAEAKRDEASLQLELEGLMRRRTAHRRRIILASAEGESLLRSRPLLNGRYQLLRLMGRGGFSEVWRTLDLDTAEEVAVKIHRTNSSWKDSRKQHYIKHAVREYAIHRSLRHQNVVRLLDVFSIDDDAFATVMELCKGPDLDAVLKERKTLPEKEARAVMLQVLSALRYFSGVDTPEAPRPAGSMPPPRASSSSSSSSAAAAPAGDADSEAVRMRVIHYDLKPANVMFDRSHTAKVTDFGLSKIVDEAHPGSRAASGADRTSIELTSQGAGTYWYLPPECFATGAAVRISNKVDVWSLGVIFYQCLYGSRPFGEGMSQDALLRGRVMLQARDPVFPEKPPVSEGAKDFIRACLQHEQRHRPDVRALCGHPYLMQGR